jgi:hypothetical protein
MSVAWKSVWVDALSATELALKKAKAPAAMRVVRDIAQARERRLRSLLAAMADGALDRRTVDDGLKEEKAILRAEFLAVRRMPKRAAQDAASALIGSIKNALF